MELPRFETPSTLPTNTFYCQESALDVFLLLIYTARIIKFLQTTPYTLQPTPFIMLAIKLSRFGKKKQPTYRVIVLEKTKDPWGDYLENLGTYNPKVQPKVIQLNAERIKYWLSKGAQPTPTVWNLLVSNNIIQAKKKSVSRMSKERAARLAAEKLAEEKSKAEVKTEAPAAA